MVCTQGALEPSGTTELRNVSMSSWHDRGAGVSTYSQEFVRASCPLPPKGTYASKLGQPRLAPHEPSYSDIWVRILIDCQRCRGVLDENMAEAHIHAFEERSDLPHDVARHQMTASLEGGQPYFLLFETHFVSGQWCRSQATARLLSSGAEWGKSVVGGSVVV